MAVALASDSKRQEQDGPAPGSSERDRVAQVPALVVYFVARYVWIYNATTTEWLPFALWPAQQMVLREMARALKLLVLKTRQLGLSWLVLAYCLRAALSGRRHHPALLPAGNEAKELLGRVKEMYPRLPEWMRARAVLKSNESQLVLSTGSRFPPFRRRAGEATPAPSPWSTKRTSYRTCAAFSTRSSPRLTPAGSCF